MFLFDYDEFTTICEGETWIALFGFGCFVLGCIEQSDTL